MTNSCSRLAPLLLCAALLSLTAACGASSTAATPARPTTPGAAPTRPAITQAEVEGAQRAWCDALVGISAAKARGEDAKALASSVLDSAYNYAEDPVLFKPTLTFGAQTFRMDKAGALAYFVGGDPAYPDDTGFALKGWTTCTPEIRGWTTDGDIAIAMGNVTIVDGKGGAVRVDKTFGYKRDATGALKIILHHSSLPFVPTAAK